MAGDPATYNALMARIQAVDSQAAAITTVRDVVPYLQQLQAIAGDGISYDMAAGDPNLTADVGAPGMGGLKGAIEGMNEYIALINSGGVDYEPTSWALNLVGIYSGDDGGYLVPPGTTPQPPPVSPDGLDPNDLVKYTDQPETTTPDPLVAPPISDPAAVQADSYGPTKNSDGNPSTILSWANTISNFSSNHPLLGLGINVAGGIATYVSYLGDEFGALVPGAAPAFSYPGALATGVTAVNWIASGSSFVSTANQYYTDSQTPQGASAADTVALLRAGANAIGTVIGTGVGLYYGSAGGVQGAAIGSAIGSTIGGYTGDAAYLAFQSAVAVVTFTTTLNSALAINAPYNPLSAYQQAANAVSANWSYYAPPAPTPALKALFADAATASGTAVVSGTAVSYAALSSPINALLFVGGTVLTNTATGGALAGMTSVTGTAGNDTYLVSEGSGNWTINSNGGYDTLVVGGGLDDIQAAITPTANGFVLKLPDGSTVTATGISKIGFADGSIAIANGQETFTSLGIATPNPTGDTINVTAESLMALVDQQNTAFGQMCFMQPETAKLVPSPTLVTAGSPGRAYLDAFNIGYIAVAAAGKMQVGMATTEELTNLTNVGNSGIPYVNEFNSAANGDADGLAFLAGMAEASGGSLAGILPAGHGFNTPIGGLEALFTQVEKTAPGLSTVLASLDGDATRFIGDYSAARANGSVSSQTAFQSVETKIFAQPGY